MSNPVASHIGSRSPRAGTGQEAAIFGPNADGTSPLLDEMTDLDVSLERHRMSRRVARMVGVKPRPAVRVPIAERVRYLVRTWTPLVLAASVICSSVSVLAWMMLGA
jgi:hypothetical protein